MKKINSIIALLLLSLVPFVSCTNDDVTTAQKTDLREITAEESKGMVVETASCINAGKPDTINAGDVFTPAEGITVTVLSVAEDLKSAVFDVVFDDYKVKFFDATVSGRTTANAELTGSGYRMTFTTGVEVALEVQGPEINDAEVELGETTVIADPATGCGFTGTIVINGQEYVFNEFLSMDQIMQILAEALGKVSWEDMANLLKNSDKYAESRVLIPLGTIYNKDGMKINLGLELNLTEPGLVLTFTFTDYVLNADAALGQTLNGTMTAFVTGYSLTVLKLVINTGDDPLVLDTGLLLKPTIRFEDVTIYYDLKTKGLAEEPAPSGTVYVAGIPIQVNSFWLEILLSLF